jgi:hypothetical protein
MGLKPIAIRSLCFVDRSIYANFLTYLALVASLSIAMGFKPIAIRQLLPLFLKAIAVRLQDNCMKMVLSLSALNVRNGRA